MKLSVFPKCDPLPENSEQKRKAAWFTAKPHKPEIRELSTDEELVDVICNYAWSPSIFAEYRLQSDFIQTDFIVLDIDDGQTIDAALEEVKRLDLMAMAIPSTSHTEENHRFRLIFPLSRGISDKETFEATNRKLAETFPADPSTLSDTARFFFGGRLVDGFFYEGSRLLDPVVPEKPRNRPRIDLDATERVEVGESLQELVEALYGESRSKVPEAIACFLENAPDNLAGKWFLMSNRFLFTCGLSNLKYDRIISVFYSLYPHDELTEDKVRKMIQDGYDARREDL